jgi:hypothetical protein
VSHKRVVHTLPRRRLVLAWAESAASPQIRQSALPRLGLRSAAVLVALLFSINFNAAGKEPRLTVQPADVDRSGLPVEFELPGTAGRFNALRDADGRVLPLQLEGNTKAWFVPTHLPAGKARTYTLIRRREDRKAPAVSAQQRDGVIRIAVDGQPVVSYQAEKSALPRPGIKDILRRGGYLHPVLTPSGRVISDDYPQKHLHHHGVWFAWTKTEFEGRAPDFWNMGDRKGTVEPVTVERQWSGPVHGGFQARHQFVDLTAPTPRLVLDESWQIRVFRLGKGTARYWLWDLESTQQCATGSPLRLPEYHYGGIGFRGHGDWDGKNNASYLTSEGETDRIKGHATRARWCHVGGNVQGVLAGVAILCHPANFRAPQPMRIHPDEPFFCYAPSQLGDWEIRPGDTYVSRYRFVVSDGRPDRAELDRIWHAYAEPARVAITANPE